LITKDFLADHEAASSPDGGSIAVGTTDHRVEIVSTTGGPPRILSGAGLEPAEELIQWSTDGRFLYLFLQRKDSGRISRLDMQTGEKALWRELKPAEAPGSHVWAARITRDGRSYTYAYTVLDADHLYVVSGLK
jgi:hypothetical protein